MSGVSNKTTSALKLEKAENDIRAALSRIGTQKALIAKMVADGHSGERAEKILRTMEASLAGFKYYRNTILEELGLCEAGESGANRGVDMPKAARPHCANRPIPE